MCRRQNGEGIYKRMFWCGLLLVICCSAQRCGQTHIGINDKSTVSKAATVCFIIAVNGPALSRCHGEGLMTVPSEQMEVKKLFGTSEGGAILAIGGSGSCCLSTSFGALAAIHGAPSRVSVIFQMMVTFMEWCSMGFLEVWEVQENTKTTCLLWTKEL